jgi:anti-sigma regulatory factor (Ser/Thr protein kinase)
MLASLDELVRGLGDDTLVTCVYAVYDPVSEVLCVANAGHVPPLLVHGDSVQQLDLHGPVLGAGDREYPHLEVGFRAGSLLALYTDGLVERRGADLQERIDGLAAVLRDAPGELRAACDAALATLDRGHDDDVALLIVRADEATRPAVARLDFVPDAVRVRDTREFVAHTLRAWGRVSEVSEQAQLVTSELVTNVVKHAGGARASVALHRHPTRLVIAVEDERHALPRLDRTAVDAESGRGLHLVDSVAHRWGARPLPDGGKIVWAELRTDLG